MLIQTRIINKNWLDRNQTGIRISSTEQHELEITGTGITGTAKL